MFVFVDIVEDLIEDRDRNEHAKEREVRIIDSKRTSEFMNLGTF